MKSGHMAVDNHVSIAFGAKNRGFQDDLAKGSGYCQEGCHRETQGGDSQAVTSMLSLHSNRLNAADNRFYAEFCIRHVVFEDGLQECQPRGPMRRTPHHHEALP